VIELLTHGSEAALDIPEAFPEGQLGKRHTQKLIVACKRADATITVVSINTLMELLLRQEIDHLGENGLTPIHGRAPFSASLKKNHEIVSRANSNRSLSISPNNRVFQVS
jgi:hypothetical protein